MLIEILTGAGLAWLYWWEIGEAGLLPPGLPQPLPLERAGGAASSSLPHTSILIGLMLAASMIDVDEKTIPDEITVVGTLVGLLARGGMARSRSCRYDNGPGPLAFLHLASPERLAGRARRRAECDTRSLWGWPVGWRGASPFCRARGTRVTAGGGPCSSAAPGCIREPSTRRILRMAVMRLAGHRPGLVSRRAGWQGLLTALVGMAASGGLVWAVRVVGTVVLQREAMGFGDVTLMAMIGAFLGWQPCLIIFFLAPFAGLVLGMLRLILFRDKEIPYGPFLCLAALVVIVRWDAVWSRTEHVFAMGWLVPAAVVCCPPLMAVDARHVAADPQRVSARRIAAVEPLDVVPMEPRRAMRRPTPAADQLRRDSPVRDVAQQGVAPFAARDLVQNGQRPGERRHARVAGRFDVLQHEEVARIAAAGCSRAGGDRPGDADAAIPQSEGFPAPRRSWETVEARCGESGRRRPR